MRYIPKELIYGLFLSFIIIISYLTTNSNRRRKKKLLSPEDNWDTKHYMERWPRETPLHGTREVKPEENAMGSDLLKPEGSPTAWATWKGRAHNPKKGQIKGDWRGPIQKHPWMPPSEKGPWRQPSIKKSLEAHQAKKLLETTKNSKEHQPKNLGENQVQKHPAWGKKNPFVRDQVPEWGRAVCEAGQSPGQLWLSIWLIDWNNLNQLGDNHKSFLFPLKSDSENSREWDLFYGVNKASWSISGSWTVSLGHFLNISLLVSSFISILSSIYVSVFISVFISVPSVFISVLVISIGSKFCDSIWFKNKCLLNGGLEWVFSTKLFVLISSLDKLVWLRGVWTNEGDVLVFGCSDQYECRMFLSGTLCGVVWFQ